MIEDDYKQKTIIYRVIILKLSPQVPHWKVQLT